MATQVPEQMSAQQRYPGSNAGIQHQAQRAGSHAEGGMQHYRSHPEGTQGYRGGQQGPPLHLQHQQGGHVGQGRPGSSKQLPQNKGPRPQVRSHPDVMLQFVVHADRMLRKGSARLSAPIVPVSCLADACLAQIPRECAHVCSPATCSEVHLTLHHMCTYILSGGIWQALLQCVWCVLISSACQH